MLNELLKFSEDHNEVHILLSIKKKQDIDKFQIEKWLDQNGAGDFFIFDAAISCALLILEGSEVSNEKSLLIAERRDATLSVRIAEDKMEAYLHFKGAYGGRTVRGSEILIAIKAAGITRGVKKGTLRKIFNKAIKLKTGEEFESIVAIGKSPINGLNGRLEYFVQDNKTRILRPQDRGDGTVDMRDLGNLLIVKPNQPLAKLIAPTSGFDGFTVTGEVLESEQGQELILKSYSGSYNKNNFIFAGISGIVTLHHDGVEVMNVICFDSISVATGHVNFTGSIVINNDIEAGMKVEATGTVAVGGSVESAIIASGGDVIVQNGILGRQPDENEGLTCIIKAKGYVAAKFAQYAKISSNKGITITHNASHCNTFTEGDFIVSDENQRNGVLNGGYHIAYGKVEVVTMGTNSETTTHVEACALINEIQSKIYKYYLQLNNLLENLQKIQNFGMRIIELPTSKRSKELSCKLILEKHRNEEKINRIRIELQTFQKKIEKHLSLHDIKIFKYCHSGLHCKFGELQLYVTDDHSRCKFYAHNQIIHRDPF